MAKVLLFRPNGKINRAAVMKAGLDRIGVVIRDPVTPEDTRALVQRRISKARGFRALKGFTDRAARRGVKHEFATTASGTGRFVRDMKPLIDAGSVVVWVNGLIVRHGRIRVA